MRLAMRNLLVALVALLSAPPACALHRFTPTLFDITSFDGGNSDKPKSQTLSARWSTFESTADLFHNGTTGQQIFLYDLQPPRALFQVTRFAHDSANPA